MVITAEPSVTIVCGSVSVVASGHTTPGTIVPSGADGAGDMVVGARDYGAGVVVSAGDLAGAIPVLDLVSVTAGAGEATVWDMVALDTAGTDTAGTAADMGITRAAPTLRDIRLIPTDTRTTRTHTMQDRFMAVMERLR